MTDKPTIVQAGVGGYGRNYLKPLLSDEYADQATLVGAVDPFPERCELLDELRERGVPIFDSLEAFTKQHTADLAILASPIQHHAPQTCLALEHGSHVLCEKPLAATIQEANAMIEARDRSGKSVAIGYQWSFSEAIQSLKADILSGALGAPVRLKTIVLWPRPHSYYNRNRWAARQRDENGAWILDSPINNATAHYLHNMFYVIGDAIDRSARPARLTAEIYRANDIENFDTGAARITTDNGVEMLYIAAHAVPENIGPVFDYEFELARVTYDNRGANIIARFNDGVVKDYGDPFGDRSHKLSSAIRVARGETESICPPEAAASQTLAVNGIQESADITDFPRDLLREGEAKNSPLVYVDRLSETLLRCYEEFKLPTEMNVPWAQAGREIDLTNYTRFPSRNQ